jgi:hypothetical protein
MELEPVDRDGIVLARIDPEVKLRIAYALRDRGHGRDDGRR